MRKDEPIALDALPDTVLRQTVERLTAGQKVAKVARWLMTQPRGALQHEPLYNVRKHVFELKIWIDAHEADSADAVPTLNPPLLIKEPVFQIATLPREATLRELEDVAATMDRVRGRSLLALVVSELFELLREVRHNRGQQHMSVPVLRELRLIAEALCKLEAAASTPAWEQFDAIDNGTRTTTGNSAGPSATAVPSQAGAFDDKLKKLLVNPAELEKTIAVLNAGTEAAELAQQLADDADLNATEPSNR